MVEGIDFYYKKDGVKITIGNVSAYCKEHGLAPQAFSGIKSGSRYEYKGYTCHTMWRKDHDESQRDKG